MKKITLLLAILLFGLGSAQESSSASERSNDFLLNPIFLILGAGNMSYERILNDDSGVGVISFFVIDDYVFKSDKSDYTTFQLAPYYHYYFGKRRASGLYIGAFTSVTSYNYYRYNRDSYESDTVFGFGFKFGGKWMLKKNWIVEAGMGLGRNFSSNKENLVAATGQFGIGKRF